MKKVILLFGLIAVTYFTGIGQNNTGKTSPATDILFIGNSYTYFWNLPQVVQGLVASTNSPIVEIYD